MFHVNDSSSHTETLRLCSSSRCVAAFLSVVQWADALWDVTDVNSRVTALIWALRIKLRLEGSSYLIEAIWIHQETSFGCSSVRLSVSREEEKMSFYTKVRAKTQITEWTSVWGRDPVCDSAAVISPSLSVCVPLADMKTLLFTLVFIVLNVSPSVLQASRVSTYIPKCINVHVHPLKRSFSWPRTRSVDVVLQRPSSGSEPKLKSTEGDAALQLVTTRFTADEQTSWKLKTSMWCTETNISWERFCKTTDRLELNVSLCCYKFDRAELFLLLLFWFGSDTRTTRSGLEKHPGLD